MRREARWSAWRAPWRLCLSPGDPYRFTVKFLALLVPAPVFTVTFTLPYLALAGTVHLICVALQETYLVTVLAPNLTELVPRTAPKPVPVMVTATPRLAEAGLSRAIVGGVSFAHVVTLREYCPMDP